jgi:hypothetical protein
MLEPAAQLPEDGSSLVVITGQTDEVPVAVQPRPEHWWDSEHNKDGCCSREHTKQ